jgi:hypothetical protein
MMATCSYDGIMPVASWLQYCRFRLLQHPPAPLVQPAAAATAAAQMAAWRQQRLELQRQFRGWRPPAAAGAGKRRRSYSCAALVPRGGAAVQPAACRLSYSDWHACVGARWDAAGRRRQQRQTAGGGWQAHSMLSKHAPVGPECHTSNYVNVLLSLSLVTASPGCQGPGGQWQQHAMAAVPQLLSPSPSQRLLHRHTTMCSLSPRHCDEPARFSTATPRRIGGEEGPPPATKGHVTQQHRNKACLTPFTSC